MSGRHLYVSSTPIHKRPVAIFDIDGTIANNDHRVHHLQQKSPKDWDSFFAEQHLDTPYENVIRILEWYYNSYYRVILLTERGEEYREVTEQWLSKYRIPYNQLIMRPKRDRTDDHLLKLEYIKYLESAGCEIVGFFDDRARICELVREHGITVFQMAKGNF